MPKRKMRSSKSSKTQEATHDENSSIMASPKMNLKLLVDRKGQRVLFAEAPKEFVDFLFHIFSLPLGVLIEFLGSNQMVGCLGKLKDSIESSNENYLQAGVKVEDIFNPKTAFNSNTFLLSYDASSEDQSAAPRNVYRCYNSTEDNYDESDSDGFDNDCHSIATLQKNSICPNCNGFMNVKMTLITPKEVAKIKEEDNKKKGWFGKRAERKEDYNKKKGEYGKIGKRKEDDNKKKGGYVKTNEVDNKKKGGYVKEVVTYMVMDDLVVKPMSTISSSLTLINKFGVKDMSQLEERMVSFGKDQGLKLLMASLKTDKVLTKIFMR